MGFRVYSYKKNYTKAHLTPGIYMPTQVVGHPTC